MRVIKPLNAESPIAVTEFGIKEFEQPTINVFVSVSTIALQLPRLSKTVFSSDTVMLVRLLHPLKGDLPIFVTDFDIEALVRPVHPANASFLISSIFQEAPVQSSPRNP